MNSYDIYDIDGTLTKPGHDLWYLTTQSIVQDKNQFEDDVQNWKQEIKSGQSPKQASEKMMQRGLDLLPLGVNAATIRSHAGAIADDIIRTESHYPQAFSLIQQRINLGIQIIFSTTNYQEGALGFLDSIIKYKLISQQDAEKITITGTQINWQTKSIHHFNMAEGKVLGIVNTLKISESELSQNTQAVYIDDPMGNDQALINLTNSVYVIVNEKNRDLNLASHCQLTTWQDIIKA